MPRVGSCDEDIRDRVWTTKNGQRVAYGELDTKHLINILLRMRRKSWERAQHEASKLHLRLGPDGWKMRQHPQWEALVEEARRRGGGAATAADLIDSDEAINEGVLRESFGLGRLPPHLESEATTEDQQDLADIFS